MSQNTQSLTEFRVQRRFLLRLYQFAGMVFVVTSIFILQLGNLQLLNGTDNRLLAKKFVSRQEFTIAPRGLMLDRHGNRAKEPLVKNINYIDFVVYPSRFKDRKDAIAFFKQFSRIMGKDYGRYADLLEEKSWKKMVRKNEAVTLLTRMTRREHERLATFHMISRYGEFLTNHLRYYSMGPALAHVTGYTGLPSRRDLEKTSIQPYQVLGKAGLEARYDTELRGTDGIRIRHRIIDTQEQITRSEQGNTLILTIDRDVQATAYRTLTRLGLRGTVIAMKATTGEILALVSNPGYDPNILASGTSDQIEQHLEQVNKHKGFLNTAIQAKFPPASTFKPLVALAALEHSGKNLTEETEYSCGGKWELKSTVPGVPPSRYFCWERRGHGRNDMVGAIAHSCNVYFYQLGYRLGPTPIIQYSRAFGMDKETGVDLPGEISGFVPDQRWKQIQWSSQWFDGDTINLSIGQGFLQTTPMELAVLYSALANGGKVYRPRLVNEVRDPDSNRTLRTIRPDLIKEVPVNRASIDTVQRGMRAVVTRGTGGFLARNNEVPIAGKTGTVQTRSNRFSTDHAWFAGYAPFGDRSEDPVVVVVFLEYGRGGSATAVPVASEIFKALFPDYKTRKENMGSIQPEVISHNQTHNTDFHQTHGDHTD